MNKIYSKFISFSIVFCLAFPPQTGFALPQGQSVVYGDAVFNTSGNTLQIQQNTDRMIANYNSFSIANGETVRFIQPSSSSMALNRVVGVSPSEIFGTLTANGQIFLVNPNGVVFGRTAQVDVGGLMASTLNITDEDFKNGNFIFSGDGGRIENYGVLSSKAGGYIILLSPQIRNEGMIVSQLGTTVLASGETIRLLNLDGEGLISVIIDQAVSENLESADFAIENLGTIEAQGGQVIITAKTLDDVFNHAINNEGVIEAKSFCKNGGTISLSANDDIYAAGRIEADGDIRMMSYDGDVVHQVSFIERALKGNVITNGGNFQGYAGRDYIVKNGTVIDSGSGIIDIFAGRDILLGSLSEDLVTAFTWDYLFGDRGYRFTEFGYYNAEGESLVYSPLTTGYDIGVDHVSVISGAGSFYGDGEVGLYTQFTGPDGEVFRYYTDPALNPEGNDHVELAGNVYGWEDMIGLGDQDFNDAIVDFSSEVFSVTEGPVLSSETNMFLTADGGSITQESGSIHAENLSMSADAGIFVGSGADGDAHLFVDHLSALNKNSGDIVIKNEKDTVIADLTGLEGINEGVEGQNGVVNNAPGGKIDLASADSMAVEAVIQTQQGDIVLDAAGDIVQSGNGNIVIAANSTPAALPKPVNLDSPSHTPGVQSSDNTIDVVWQVEDPVFETAPASFNAAAGGEYVMNEGTQIQTNNGDAVIVAGGDVKLALVDANMGHVSITSLEGSILDHDLGTVPDDYDVIGHQIVLSADNGSVGGPGLGEEIDTGNPYDFSYIWEENAGASPDLIPEAGYTSFLDENGEWVFAHTSDPLADSDNWWFHVATVAGKLISDKASIGPFVIGSLTPPPAEGRGYGEEPRTFRVYYEILSPSQFLSFEPATAIGLYAYHPLTPVDETAFDDIRLDVEAYEFIDDNIRRKGEFSPYFGE